MRETELTNTEVKAINIHVKRANEGLLLKGGKVNWYGYEGAIIEVLYERKNRKDIKLFSGVYNYHELKNILFGFTLGMLT